MIRWRCKACGFETMLREELRGQKVRCPKCGAVGQVPGDVVRREGRLQNARKKLQEQRLEGTAVAGDEASKKRFLAAILILCAGAAVAVLLWLAL